VFPAVPTITVEDLPAGSLLLDVREDDEWRAGHIDEAIHVPMNLLPNKLAYEPGPLTIESRIVVVCKKGRGQPRRRHAGVGGRGSADDQRRRSTAPRRLSWIADDGQRVAGVLPP